EVVDWFETYEWPGNVRELKNQIERLCILSGSNNRIELELLSSQLNGKSVASKKERRASNRRSLKDRMRTVERKTTELELKQANWNKSIASRMLGISRASLNNKIEKFSISRNDPY
ncbi:MAG: hypothetical protein GY941_20680, partial [Planctomycetes bacterium]|nr:hypothetical protein [Planctomycetota bacterium]